MFRGQAINSTHGGIRIQECVKESVFLYRPYGSRGLPLLYFKHRNLVIEAH